MKVKQVIFLVGKYIRYTLIAISIIFSILTIMVVLTWPKPYLQSCHNFLDKGLVDKWNHDNTDMIARIKPFTVNIGRDYDTCPGKAGMIIQYATRRDEWHIIREIGSLFSINGLPYSMENV